jgi:kumamolisin
LNVPAELDGIITGIYGLDNRKVMRRRGRNRGVHVTERIAAVPGAPTGFFLGDLARLYDFSDGDGKGQSIGLLEFGRGLLPDVLTAFCQQAGIDVPNIVPVSVDNAPDGAGDGLAYCVSAAGGGYHAGTGCDAVTGWARPWAKNCSPP